MNFDLIAILQKYLSMGVYNNIYFALGIYIFVTLFDFGLGVVKAVFSEKESFKSAYLKEGLIQKVGIIILMFVLMFISILIPQGTFVYYTALFGFVLAEVWSISSHLGLVEDDKEDINFYKKIFKKLFIFFENSISDNKKESDKDSDNNNKGDV